MKKYLALLALASPLAAQVTPATGDTRTITEPSALLNSPTICATVKATKYIAWTTAKNIDPGNYWGCPGGAGTGNLGCTGGRSPEPSSVAPNASAPAVSSNYAAAETKDNPALLTAMNSCPAGEVVELSVGTSGQNAFVFGPISAVNSSGAGIYISTDAGIRNYASLSPADYAGGSCGTMGTASTNCGSSTTSGWLFAPNGGGYIGYGIWDQRLWDTFTTGVTTQSFGYQRIYTYCAEHGVAKNGSWTCPAGSTTSGYGIAYGPTGFNFVGNGGGLVYKATLLNGAGFLSQTVNVTGSSTGGCVFWDAKLFAPFNISNSDGWDPLNTTNCTFTHGYISNGDNHTALKATGSPTSNITFSYSQTGAGIGVAIGTDITKGVTNFLATGITQNGNLNNSAQQVGAEITCGSHTGAVAQVTFQNFCQRNESSSALNIIANSSGCKYSNILAQNFNNLSNGNYNIQGVSGATIGAQVNNLQTSGTPGGSSQYANIYNGPGSSASSIITKLGCGANNVVCTGSPSGVPIYPCTSSTWQPLTGELNIQNPAGLNNNQTYSGAGPIVLEAVIQPTTEINSKESAYPSAGVQFYDNGAAIGSPVTPTGDGTTATYTVSSVSSGTHNYTAKYNTTGSDANYPTAFAFGAVTAVNGTPTSPVQLIVNGQIVWQGNVVVH